MKKFKKLGLVLKLLRLLVVIWRLVTDVLELLNLAFNYLFSIRFSAWHSLDGQQDTNTNQESGYMYLMQIREPSAKHSFWT